MVCGSPTSCFFIFRDFVIFQDSDNGDDGNRRYRADTDYRAACGLGKDSVVAGS